MASPIDIEMQSCECFVALSTKDENLNLCAIAKDQNMSARGEVWLSESFVDAIYVRCGCLLFC